MLQPATRTTDLSIAEFGPTGLIRQTIPNAFAFALGRAPVLNTRIPLGKVVTVAVADGRCAEHDLHDMFARRVPVIPAVTGPVHVAGVRRGDILEIEVIALEADESGSIGPLLATVGAASMSSQQGVDPAQFSISAGGVVWITARQPGGLIQFGPVVARRNRRADLCEEPVAARMMVRCSVIQAQGA
ncbi:MAG: hypothetical protein K0Q89_2145 [Thermomicrobiales bacterium]|jgi:hypothetical protein|nr:hypothetical protein [Thermomicrobiales bacterium]